MSDTCRELSGVAASPRPAFSFYQTFMAPRQYYKPDLQPWLRTMDKSQQVGGSQGQCFFSGILSNKSRPAKTVSMEFVLIGSMADLGLSPISLGQKFVQGKPSSCKGWPSSRLFNLWVSGQDSESHCENWITTGGDLPLGSECSWLQVLCSGSRENCFQFLCHHFCVFNLGSLLVLDVTSAGKCFIKYIGEKDSNDTKQTTSFSGVPLLSLGALLPKSVSVDE